MKVVLALGESMPCGKTGPVGRQALWEDRPCGKTGPVGCPLSSRALNCSINLIFTSILLCFILDIFYGFHGNSFHWFKLDQLIIF